MSLILRQIIGYQQGRKSAPTTAPSLELTQTKNQLNSILNKWKFGDQPIRTSEEFLANFEPWINSQQEKQKELKLFLAKKGVNSLAEAETKLSNRDLSESAELEQVRQELTTKEQEISSIQSSLTNKEQELTQLQETWNNTETDYLRRIEELKENRETSEEVETIKQELAEKEQTWQNTEQDYLKQIQELKENQVSSELSESDQEKLAEYEDLITERDEAIREKRTLEQEVLALNNRLNNKNQEVQNKEKALEKLKREKNQAELNQQKQLKEKNSLITTLNQEIKQFKDKYSKQSKLLDTEQLESKKLEEENEKLQIKIQELEKERGRLITAQ